MPELTLPTKQESKNSSYPSLFLAGSVDEPLRNLVFVERVIFVGHVVI